MGTLCISAYAVERMPLEQAQQDAGYATKYEAPVINPRMNDTFKCLNSTNLTGLQNDKYYYNPYGHAGYEFPRQVGYVKVDLATTGSGKTVRTGFGTMDWSTGTLNAVAVSNQNLKSSTYKFFNDYSTSTTYYSFITNHTGGVLTGSVIWYSMLS